MQVTLTPLPAEYVPEDDHPTKPVQTVAADYNRTLRAEDMYGRAYEARARFRDTHGTPPDCMVMPALDIITMPADFWLAIPSDEPSMPPTPVTYIHGEGKLAPRTVRCAYGGAGWLDYV